MGLFDWFSSEKKLVNNQENYSEKVDFSDFKKVTDYIYIKSGIVDLDKRAFISSKLQQYAISEHIYTTKMFLDSMERSTTFFQEVINIATVNETFFMREVKELEWLVNYIKECNKPLKILSIPSSSGEEIYSILLLMYKENLDMSKISFVGCDINSEAVASANEGKYNQHSLHKLDEKTKNKYFSDIGDKQYKIDESLKTNVRFKQKNIFELVDENGEYDVVLSRNMFIYFDEEKRDKALNIIVSLLKNSGIYIKGHADYIKYHQQLENVEYGIYRKK